MTCISWSNDLSQYFYTILLPFIILVAMVHSDIVTDIISLLGHCDLYFTVQRSCYIASNLLGV